MKLALDTNVLAYAEGINGATARQLAWELLEKLPSSSVLIPVQALGELFQVLVRKGGRHARQANTAILLWRDLFPAIDTTDSILLAAMDLCVQHRLNIWDAVILSSAADAQCRLLLSEDMHEGFTWAGVTIINPFAKKKHDLLEQLLEH